MELVTHGKPTGGSLQAAGTVTRRLGRGDAQPGVVVVLPAPAQVRRAMGDPQGGHPPVGAARGAGVEALVPLQRLRARRAGRPALPRWSACVRPRSAMVTAASAGRTPQNSSPRSTPTTAYTGASGTSRTGRKVSTSAKCRLSVPGRPPSDRSGTRSDTGSTAGPGTSTNDARAGSATTASSRSRQRRQEHLRGGAYVLRGSPGPRGRRPGGPARCRVLWQAARHLNAGGASPGSHETVRA